MRMEGAVKTFWDGFCVGLVQVVEATIPAVACLAGAMLARGHFAAGLSVIAVVLANHWMLLKRSHWLERVKWGEE